ncbi:MAG: N-acetylmuramoyl-L-alanine amidase [Pseudomonadota bacterium]
MIRVFLLSLFLAFSGAAQAQDMTGLARAIPDKSIILDRWGGQTALTLTLTQGVPYRVFWLDAPARLVLDFQEVDWSGVAPEAILPKPGRITSLRFGTTREGWSRLIADLAQPMMPQRIGLSVEPGGGEATLSLTLKTVDQASFAATAGAPDALSLAEGPMPASPHHAARTERFTVVLDPGHGGPDPGAVRQGTAEKDIMLKIALGVEEALIRAGATVITTRSDDIFVPLEHRVAVAQRAEADAFVSLHADSLSNGRAKGATIYTLSDEASDTATALLAARHNRTDLLAGVNLDGAEDQIAKVLMDLARQETAPRALALAEALVAQMTQAGGPMNTRPLRRGGFSVLKSADIPSVLIEVGFLSSDRDLKNMRDPLWRAGMVDAIAEGLLVWRDQERTRAPLVRQ